ncbi:MAG: YggS family pyridoxal phosphate-dependent enzyme [Ruminococcaceae bacterium]|nr:YggS family pyridoxal phosphate-dependent enzyme [Oscillospiraceae bacterium]
MENLSNETVFRDIEENYRIILQNLDMAATQAGVDRDDIRFMAVTKTVPPVFVNHALQLGIDLIGENKVQELLEKKEFLNGKYDAHLIGHLQTNKVKKIIREVTMIQSVDSVKLACEISKQAKNADLVMPVLLELNIGEEESKTGFLPQNFTENALEIAEMDAIQVCGVMSVPPICDSQTEIRIWFEKVRKQYEKLKDNAKLKEMNILSMGMSSDYVQAVLEGANLVRVGSALFGHRRY